ncbi:MAG: DUF2298 domain-containing protein [Anaerolineales bacterium]
MIDRYDHPTPYFWLSPITVLMALVLGALLLFQQELSAELAWDWLGREADDVLIWWLLSSLAGLAAWPLLARLLPDLPSRGYAVARAAGLMLVGFIFWFAGSLGLWTNTPGAIVLAWLLVLGAAAYVWRISPPETRPNAREWWQKHWTFVLVIEILFVAMLFGWALFRAHQPEISSTEKPMEFMFISSIRQSEIFPPQDAWLAGYSISYYYFGYVITAGLADLAGMNTGTAFGLIGPLLFALTGIGIVGLIYDLVRARGPLGRWLGGGRHAGIWFGILGLVLMLLMGNLGTFLIEMPWNGRGFMASSASMDYFEFWDMPERSRLAIDTTPGMPGGIRTWDRDGLTEPGEELDLERYILIPDENRDGIPDWEQADLARDFTDWRFFWWFNYSRVISDTDLPAPGAEKGVNSGINPIVEMPVFSFILSDIHPHVLALPFSLLALTLAAGLAFRQTNLPGWGYILLAIWVGGMIFMNSWDAIYLPFLFGAEVLRRLMRNRQGVLHPGDLWGALRFALIISVLSLVFYLPWLLSFTSQADGILFNVLWPTLPQQWFLHFGTFFVIMLPFLALELWWGRRTVRWWIIYAGFPLLFIITALVPFGGVLLYHGVCQQHDGSAEPGAIVRAACNAERVTYAGERFDTPETRDDFWQTLLARRARSFPNHAVILLGITMIVARLFGRPYELVTPASAEVGAPKHLPYHPASGFALLTLGAGFVLLMTPELVFLNDNFDVRANTIFKLYYQVWLLFSVAAAYGAYAVLSGLNHLWEARQHATEEAQDKMTMFYPFPPRAGWRLVYVTVMILFLLMGLVYPYYATRARALEESGRYAARERPLDDERPLTLDGRATAVSQDELDVILCIERLVGDDDVVIAEAPFNGGYNSRYSRVGMLTGIPIPLGWINHQRQWRGATYDTVTEALFSEDGVLLESREMLIDRFYRTEDWDTVRDIAERYGLDYVMVGGAEADRYGDDLPGLSKFAARYTPVCSAGDVAIYPLEFADPEA